MVSAILNSVGKKLHILQGCHLGGYIGLYFSGPDSNNEVCNFIDWVC